MKIPKCEWQLYFIIAHLVHCKKIMQCPSILLWHWLKNRTLLASKIIIIILYALKIVYTALCSIFVMRGVEWVGFHYAVIRSPAIEHFFCELKHISLPKIAQGPLRICNKTLILYTTKALQGHFRVKGSGTLLVSLYKDAGTPSTECSLTKGPFIVWK